MTATPPPSREMLATMIETYVALADTWRDIGRPADEADCRAKAAALEYGGVLDLSSLLTETAP